MMSYDVTLTGAETREVELHEANVTYNLAPMFYEALGGDGLRGLDGRGARQCRVKLDVALGEMTADPEKYRAMNPPNGWGTYEGALGFLKELYDACLRHPDATVHVT